MGQATIAAAPPARISGDSTRPPPQLAAMHPPAWTSLRNAAPATGAYSTR